MCGYTYNDCTHWVYLTLKLGSRTVLIMLRQNVTPRKSCSIQARGWLRIMAQKTPSAKQNVPNTTRRTSVGDLNRGRGSAGILKQGGQVMNEITGHEDYFHSCNIIQNLIHLSPQGICSFCHSHKL